MASQQLEVRDAPTNADQPSSDADRKPPLVAPSELVVYDKDGDLIICVGPESRRYRIDSKTLSRSSPVFKKMLFGGFAESRPSDGGDWTVDLPDDDSTSMDIMLNIVHGAFEFVPEYLSLKHLYSLLALTEKYDATRLLRPWARAWIQNEAIKDQTGEPELLSVAWEMGDSGLFYQMVDIIANECHINDKGNVIYGRRERIHGSARLGPSQFAFRSLVFLVPPDMERLIDAELKPYITLYASSKSNRCTEDLEEGKRWRCDSTVLGSLIKSLSNAQIDITTPNAAGLYTGSVANLRIGLSGTTIVSNSKECDRSIRETIIFGKVRAMQLREEIKTVCDSHREYLYSQARKTGL
ncbi:hypothetical protein LZ30DRAFT_592637 [Colletotrichum cereale]|nr:hypothetical protein LZ30DRAFT_592637 [Colletotrichum cereale]